MTQDFKHCNDLKHTLLTLHNLIADSSRKCQLNRPSFIHAVPENCKAIEEATLAREKVGGKERDCKTQLSQFHCEEGADCMHNCRKPNEVDSFEAFRKKRDRIEDCAVDIVRTMCCEDQKSRKKMREEIEKNKKERAKVTK